MNEPEDGQHGILAPSLQELTGCKMPLWAVILKKKHQKDIFKKQCHDLFFNTWFFFFQFYLKSFVKKDEKQCGMWVPGPDIGPQAAIALVPDPWYQKGQKVISF